MSRKIILALALAAGTLAATPATTVDEIVAANAAARGGLKTWQAVQSLRLSGRMDMGKGMQAPFTLQLKRPHKMRLEFLFDGQMVVQAFDGKNGWKRQPYLGRAGYEPMSEEEARGSAGLTDLDGPLLDYKAKGNTVKLTGRVPVEGHEAIRLVVTVPGGSARPIYLDAATFLEVKVDSTRRMRGEDRAVETFYRDYRKVDELLIPYRLETKVAGAPSSNQMIIERVEVNPEMDDALFTPPPSAPVSQGSKP